MEPVRHPVLLEVSTRIWLHELSRQTGRSINLSDVSEAVLDQISAQGFDWLWLMGVWQTGDAGRRIVMEVPGWRDEYRRVLPDLRDDDVSSSPFAVQGYTAHRDFGGDDALRSFRSRLHSRGVRLMLDFVGNHTALDHPWVETHPEYYVHGSEMELARAPGNYIRLTTPRGPLILAHGRDPYFPGWRDTLQLNYRHPALRKAMIGELRNIAELGDGVRCDMAMLLLPDVFLATWGDAALPADGALPVDTPFWPEAIADVHKRQPTFVFMAEAYWDREWTLQQQGFAFTYDKRLYDRLRSLDAEAVRGHLHADLDYQKKSVRFLENHDEPRAASVFPPNVHQAAAVVAYLVPGMRFFHRGQLEGCRLRPSVHLSRRPDEPVDPALSAFYQRLLTCLKRPEPHSAQWRLLECRPAWEGNPTAGQFVAFAWDGLEKKRLVIAVNYGPTQGQCLVQLPFGGLRGQTFALRDLMSDAKDQRAGDDLESRGLYLDLPEWGYRVFEMTAG